MLVNVKGQEPADITQASNDQNRRFVVGHCERLSESRKLQGTEAIVGLSLARVMKSVWLPAGGRTNCLRCVALCRAQVLETYDNG